MLDFVYKKCWLELSFIKDMSLKTTKAKSYVLKQEVSSSTKSKIQMT